MKKCILSAFALLLSCSMLTGCNSSEKVKVATCRGGESYDVRFRFDFTLDNNEKDIKEVKFIQTVNKENIEKVYPDKDLKETYEAFKNDMEYQYDKYLKDNENLSWFKAKIDKKPKEYYAQLTFAFDVSSEDLDISDDTTVKFLQEFGVNMFYNPDEKAFLYEEKEFLSKVPISGMYKPTCSINEVEKKQSSFFL